MTWGNVWPMHPRIEALLREEAIEYRVHRHQDYNQPIQSPADFAAALGYDIRRITKTLLLKSTSEPSRFCLAALSAPDKINLPYLAELTSTKRLKMAGAMELTEQIGYPPLSVTPLAAGTLPVFVEEALLRYETILTGAGVVGVEIELKPSDFVRLCSAQVIPLKAPATVAG